MDTTSIVNSLQLTNKQGCGCPPTSSSWSFWDFAARLFPSTSRDIVDWSNASTLLETGGVSLPWRLAGDSLLLLRDRVFSSLPRKCISGRRHHFTSSNRPRWLVLFSSSRLVLFSSNRPRWRQHAGSRGLPHAEVTKCTRTYINHGDECKYQNRHLFQA